MVITDEAKPADPAEVRVTRDWSVTLPATLSADRLR